MPVGGRDRRSLPADEAAQLLQLGTHLEAAQVDATARPPPQFGGAESLRCAIQPGTAPNSPSAIAAKAGSPEERESYLGEGLEVLESLSPEKVATAVEFVRERRTEMHLVEGTEGIYVRVMARGQAGQAESERGLALTAPCHP